MTKYINAELLREKIEKTYKSEIQPWLSGVSATSAIYDYVLPLIDSLQQEQQEKPIPKDLEEAAEKHATDYDSTIWCVLESSNQKTIWKREHKETYIAGAKWQYQKDRAEFAKLKAKEWSDGYDEGITKGKEQMLKEAVEADVNFYGDIVAGKKWAEFVVEMPTKNLSDKVRIIIVKED